MQKDNEDILQVDVQLQPSHVYNYIFYHSFGTFKGILFLVVGLGAFVALIYTWAASDTLRRVLLGVIAGYNLLLSPLMVWWKAHRLAKMPQFQVPMHFTFGTTEVRVRQGEEEILYYWEDGFRFVCRPRTLMIYVSMNAAYILPKDQLGEDFDRILAMARERGCLISAR